MRTDPSYPILRRAAVALTTMLLCVACGGRGSSSDDTVRVYISGDPASLSLIGKTDRVAEALAVQITDSLVQYGADLRLQPRLAESWEFSDDRRTLTFHLREGVRWHDGRPLVADDVVFTVRQVLDTAVENRNWSPLFRDLVDVDAPDERTVRATYGVATADALEAWRLPILPLHAAESGAELLTGEYSRHPIGCGPYRFVRYERGQQIVLEANPDYWDGPPKIERLILRIYPDQRTAYHSLLRQELDIMQLTSNLWDDARTSPEAARFERKLMRLFSAWIVMWNQNGDRPHFVDPAVRQAMVLALDREAFIENVVLGLAQPGVTTFHPDTFWADPDGTPLPYDPQRAAELLDSAGWIDSDGDGIRDRDGVPFEFTLLIPVSNQKLVDQMASWSQQSWAELGVKARIERTDFQTLRSRRNAGDYDALVLTLTFTPNPDQFELYHSTARGENGMNAFGLADPEVDRLLESGRRTFDPEQRREVYIRLQRRLFELEPITPLFYFVSPVLFDGRLRGVRTSPLGYLPIVEGPRVWHWDTEPAGG